MKLRRILAVVTVVSIVFGVAIWLVLRGSEPDSPIAAPPSTSLAFNRPVVVPLPTEPGEGGETPPAMPDIGLPGMSNAKNGQLLLEMLSGITAVPKAQPETIEPYLRQQNRSAGSLLAAWQASGSSAYLREAATRFENDPQVQLMVLASGEFPEDRARWIALFKQGSSFNSLANYLAAQESFHQNQTDQAVAEMVAASGKQGFDDYAAASFQESENAFLATGVLPTDARARGFAVTAQTMQPYVEALANVAQAATAAQATYATADDPAAAQRLAQSVVMLGRQMNSAGPGRLVAIQSAGIDLEQAILKQLPADEPVDWLGQTPAARLADLQQQKDQIEAAEATYTSVLPRLSESEFAEYLDRVKQSGELEAMKWLASRRQSQ